MTLSKYGTPNGDNGRRKCMILRSFDYVEYKGEDNEWSIDALILEKVNLLVGKNASGKSRTIDKIAAFAGLIFGYQKTTFEVINSVNFEVELTENEYTYIYSLSTKNRDITSEKLTINGVEKINRLLNGSGQMYYENEKKDIAFQALDNNLIVASRRDNIQHPYLENLYKWASGIRFFDFGSSRNMGQRNMLATVNLDEFTNDEKIIYETFRVNEHYLKAIREFGEKFNKKIIDDMRLIGYDLVNLSIETNPYTAVIEENNSPLFMLCVKEKDRNAKLYQTGMSQGMFRALSLLIQVNYNIMKNTSSIILVDDIGEGLDFERSAKLIALLIELAETNDNIQLIMSTNDRFVMNNVPLEYWQVIQRNGGECKIFNYHNSKEKFDEFQYMGLNNFDFLATDFINSKWEKA